MTGFRPPTTGGDLPTDNITGGYWDYSDALTPVTPIVVTGGGGPVVLTNDTLGAQTLKTFAPNGVVDIWDASTNEFKWDGVGGGGGLSVGTRVGIRLDVDIITTSQNTEVRIDMSFAGGLFTLAWLNLVNYKNSGTQQVTEYIEFHIGSAFVLAGDAQFMIESDKNCTVVVIGYYCSIANRG